MTQTHGGNWLIREDLGDVTVVRIKLPRLDDDRDTRSIFEAIYKLLDVMGRSRLVINLASVEKIQSLGIGKMVMLNRKAANAGGRLALCELTPVVAEVIESSYLNELLVITQSEEEAVKAVSQAIS